MTGSAKTDLIAHDMKFTFFCHKPYCQNEEVLGGLLLLAVSSQPIGDLYERSGSIMELWWEGRELSVTIKLRGVE